MHARTEVDHPGCLPGLGVRSREQPVDIFRAVDRRLEQQHTIILRQRRSLLQRIGEQMEIVEPAAVYLDRKLARTVQRKIDDIPPVGIGNVSGQRTDDRLPDVRSQILYLHQDAAAHIKIGHRGLANMMHIHLCLIHKQLLPRLPRQGNADFKITTAPGPLGRLVYFIFVHLCLQIKLFIQL
ncbi:hypothetical protein D3C73_1067320 [compost metagenome]